MIPSIERRDHDRRGARTKGAVCRTLTAYLRSLDVDRLQDVIASLEAYEDKYAAEHVVPGTIVLLNLLPDLPERQRGIFDLGTRLTVTRVTYRLLRALRDPSAVEAAVRQILPELNSLSAKLEVITDVGYREGAGHKLVSRTAAAEFERGLRDEVRARPTDDLKRERDLIGLLLFVKREAGPSEGPLVIDAAPQLTLAVLRSARTEIRSQGIGTRAVRRSPRLAWEVLLDLYGDETTLRARIEDLKATNPRGVGDLFELADRYLRGWRPNDFGDDES